MNLHDYLTAQTERADTIGDLARDYAHGVAHRYHGRAETLEQLREILRAHRACDDAHRAVDALASEVTR